MPRRLKWVAAALAATAALVVGGTWVYIHVVEGDAPAALGLSSAPPATSGTTTTSGTWRTTDGSRAGYRVNEVLFGQQATAVGRTERVTGEVAIAGSKVANATFTVDMASVTSDRSRRDGQYRDRIMSTDQFPTSTFKLTSPIDLGGEPANGATVDAKATGDLTLRGVTRSVTFDVKARRTGSRLEVTGSIPVVFEDWGIPSPSFGPAQVEDHGAVEFLLVLAPA